MTDTAGTSAAAIGISPNPTMATSVRPARCRAGTSAIVHKMVEENTAVGGSGASSRFTISAAASPADSAETQTRSGLSSSPFSATADR